MATSRSQRKSRNNNNGAGKVTARTIRQIILANQEVKQFTSPITAGTVFSGTGQIVHLTPIAQGDAISQRSGTAIKMKELRLQVTAYMATAGSSITWRLIVFTDSMGNGSVVNFTDLLETANFTSPYNAINRQRNRFKIYHDKNHTLVGGTNKQEVTDLVVTRPNTIRFFNDGTANSTNIGKNTLYFAIISSVNAGVYAFQYGLKYTDS